MIAVILPALFLPAAFGGDTCEVSACESGQTQVQSSAWNLVVWGCPLDQKTRGLIGVNESYFQDCCVQHDLCYQTCGAGVDKSYCEAVFARCLRKRCTQAKANLCQYVVQAFEEAFESQNCTAWDERQRWACTCVPDNEATAWHTKALEALYGRISLKHTASNFGKRDLPNPGALVQKWLGKEGQLFLKAAFKHYDAHVTWLEGEDMDPETRNEVMPSAKSEQEKQAGLGKTIKQVC